jgi:hypothetical protein
VPPLYRLCNDSLKSRYKGGKYPKERQLRGKDI